MGWDHDDADVIPYDSFPILVHGDFATTARSPSSSVGVPALLLQILQIAPLYARSTPPSIPNYRYTLLIIPFNYHSHSHSHSHSWIGLDWNLVGFIRQKGGSLSLLHDWILSPWPFLHRFGERLFLPSRLVSSRLVSSVMEGVGRRCGKFIAFGYFDNYKNQTPHIHTYIHTNERTKTHFAKGLGAHTMARHTV